MRRHFEKFMKLSNDKLTKKKCLIGDLWLKEMKAKKGFCKLR